MKYVSMQRCMMSEIKRTCDNCGFDKCKEAVKRLNERGIPWETEYERVEIIYGTAWKRICAYWIPKSAANKEIRVKFDHENTSNCLASFKTTCEK